MILENLSSDLSLKTISRQASMSMRNHSRVFQEEAGTTPGDFIEWRGLTQLGAFLKKLTPASKGCSALRFCQSGHNAPPALPSTELTSVDEAPFAPAGAVNRNHGGVGALLFILRSA